MTAQESDLVLVYGETDRIGVVDATDHHFVIVTRDAAEKLSAARDCRTWGEYADLCGKRWDDFLEDYGGEVQDVTGLEEPGPDAPFEFDRIYGLYYAGDLIPEPRTAAYEVLVKLPRAVRQDSRLGDLLEWNGGSPAGHIASVTAQSEEAIRLFERIIHEAGHGRYRFERNDTLVDRVAGC